AIYGLLSKSDRRIQPGRRCNLRDESAGSISKPDSQPDGLSGCVVCDLASRRDFVASRKTDVSKLNTTDVIAVRTDAVSFSELGECSGTPRTVTRRDDPGRRIAKQVRRVPPHGRQQNRAHAIAGRNS